MVEPPEGDEYQPRFIRQIEDVFDEDTTWVDIGKQADVSSYSYGGSYASWHASTSFRAMFLALLWVHVEDISISAIPTQLAQNPELASVFGYDPKDLPAPSTFRRTWSNRFEELQSAIERNAKQVCDLAAQYGCPIGTSALRPRGSAAHQSGLKTGSFDRIYPK